MTFISHFQYKYIIKPLKLDNLPLENESFLLSQIKAKKLNSINIQLFAIRSKFLVGPFFDARNKERWTVVVF